MPSGSEDIGSMERTARLSAFFLQRLHELAGEVYAPFLREGTVRPEEVEEEVQAYFYRKKSGLQDVYSYYGQQWDYYYQMAAAPDESFLLMLQRARSQFARLYPPTELDAAYYMEQLARHARSDARWQLLRRHFMQKWRRLLERREWDYQVEHVRRLCEEYYRVCQEHGDAMRNEGRGGGGLASRLSWLQLACTLELKKKIRQLAAVMRKSPLLRELELCLGRKRADEERLYQATAGQMPVRLLRPATHSDIVGITEGDDLNALMPVEYCFLADRVLEPLFYRRYTEKKLAVFESVSRQREQAEASFRRGHDTERHSRRGPFVACVDTSGSMRGERELLAKAVVLGLALMADRLRRVCRVTLFSDQVETIELENLHAGLPQLEKFLCGAFHGGSDISCALHDSAETLRREDFCYADLLWISDFEMPPVAPASRCLIEELKGRGARVYAVAFGRRAEPSYVELADRVWWAD